MCICLKIIVLQVTADTFTLGLMVYASILDPLIEEDKIRIDLIYLAGLLIQVKECCRKYAWFTFPSTVYYVSIVSTLKGVMSTNDKKTCLTY